MFSFEPRCQGLRQDRGVTLDVGGNREDVFGHASLCLDPRSGASAQLVRQLAAVPWASAATTVVVSLRGIFMSAQWSRVLRSTRVAMCVSIRHSGSGGRSSRMPAQRDSSISAGPLRG